LEALKSKYGRFYSNCVCCCCAIPQRGNTMRIMGTSLRGIAVLFSLLWAVAPLIDVPVAREPSGGPHCWDKARFLPGIRQPGTHPADAVPVPDSAAVVGIEAGGIYRAYLLMGMTTPELRVINDLPGGIPVSLAYCNLKDCAKAYSARNGSGEPLDLGVHGLIQGQLVLSAKGGAYLQEPMDACVLAEQPDRLPYYSYPLERATWGAWRQEHPDTDIYIGDWLPGN
jgi:hypothetical protein